MRRFRALGCGCVFALLSKGFNLGKDNLLLLGSELGEVVIKQAGKGIFFCWRVIKETRFAKNKFLGIAQGAGNCL